MALILTEISLRRTDGRCDSSMAKDKKKEALLSRGKTFIREGNTNSDSFNKKIQAAKNIIGTFTA